MGTPLTARLAEELASSARALPAALVTPRRRAALEALSALGLPTTRDENWKYANLRPLERLRFVPAAPAAADPAPAAAALPAPLPGCDRYVFVDGWFAPACSAAPTSGALLVTPLAQRLRAAGPARELVPATAAARVDDRFAVLNEALAADGAFIEVQAGARDSGPCAIELLFLASAPAQAGASYPRVELHLADGADLTLIERHASIGADDSFVNSAVTVELGRGARLQHYRLQELGARAVAFDTLSAVLARDATYHLLGIGTGALAARSTLMFRLAGEQAQLALALAALGDRQQVQDTYARVEHTAPRTRTEQTFRGIAAGRARVACNGKILVANEARGTDSRQSLRGLLAGPEAEIDVRPQLEIYTDEVRCSHGATVGKLDDDMLFYLLSRGLEPATAQRLLKWAFLEDVIAQVALAPLRREIETRLAGVLQDAALQELL